MEHSDALSYRKEIVSDGNDKHSGKNYVDNCIISTPKSKFSFYKIVMDAFKLYLSVS